MKFHRMLLLIAFQLISFAVIAQNKEKKNEEEDDDVEVFDTLFLNNKQILIGELKGIAAGKAKIDADQIDVVDVELKNIKAIKATSHSYRIETIHREIFTSDLLPDKAHPGFALIKDSGTVKSIKIEDILSLQRLNIGNTGFWNGAFAIGYSYSRASDIGLLNADGAVNYITPKYEISPYFALFLAQVNGKWYRSNEALGTLGYYNINPSWQYLGTLAYQRNLRLGVAHRYQEGFGLAYKVLTTNSIKFKTGSGVLFNEEESVADVYKKLQLEIPSLNTLELYHFDDPEINILLIQNLYFSLTQIGRIRHEGQIKLNWELMDDLYVHLAFYDYYDSKPIYEFASKLDLGVLFGFTFTFSQ